MSSNLSHGKVGYLLPPLLLGRRPVAVPCLCTTGQKELMRKKEKHGGDITDQVFNLLLLLHLINQLFSLPLYPSSPRSEPRSDDELPIISET